MFPSLSSDWLYPDTTLPTYRVIALVSEGRLRTEGCVDNGDIEFIGYKNPGVGIAKARYSDQQAENDCSDDDLGSDSDSWYFSKQLLLSPTSTIE